MLRRRLRRRRKGGRGRSRRGQGGISLLNVCGASNVNALDRARYRAHGGDSRSKCVHSYRCLRETAETGGKLRTCVVRTYKLRCHGRKTRFSKSRRRDSRNRITRLSVRLFISPAVAGVAGCFNRVTSWSEHECCMILERLRIQRRVPRAKS